MGTFTALSALVLSMSTAQAAPPASPCVIYGNDGRPLHAIQMDALYQVLSQTERCPEDVFELRQLLAGHGGRLVSTMVANRGFHNAALGSFSFFEMVEGMPLPLGGATKAGDFFFGHFVGGEGSSLVALQGADEGNLMVELIVWDAVKGMYNFYELIGDGSRGRWFYRGDSADIVADAQWLHRERSEGTPVFGNRLRCTGCHMDGGPIMKELAAPHNDWWRSERPLPLAGRSFESRLQPIANGLQAPGLLASAVSVGNRRLQNSAAYRAALEGQGLQVLLRPLFAPQEVNFESDPEGDERGRSPRLAIPGAFFIDPLLYDAGPVTASRVYYESLLTKYGTSFPETGRNDGDHAWLAPVKSAADHEAIKALMANRVVDLRFVRAVLAIDFTNPAFSPVRAALLKLVPQRATPHWRDDFIERLRGSDLPGAKELAENLVRADREGEHYEALFGRYMRNVRARALTEGGLEEYFRLLLQRRLEVAASEISQNPRGRILEPGFRVIFPAARPVNPALAPVAGKLTLNAEGYLMDGNRCAARLR